MNETNINSCLPNGFKYVIISSKYSDEDHFEAVIRLNANSKDKFLTWLYEFEQITKTNWIVRNTYPKIKKLIYRVDYVCQRSSFNQGLKSVNGLKFTKKCDCKARLKFKLSIINERTLKTNVLLKDDLQGIVIITNNHNHTTKTASALSLLRPNVDCKQQFESYFNNGLNVADAMKFHVDKLGLLADCSEAMLANGSINPKYSTVRWWYDQWRLTNLGPQTSSEILELLEKKIYLYKESGVNIILHHDPLVIIIITPIMKRANMMKEAGEIIFIDSTAGFDSCDHSVTFMMTRIVAGVVPLCIIITSGQTSAEYELAFNLFNAAAEGVNFGGKGYPEIILFNDSDDQHVAIKNVYPKSELKLCLFNVQQTVWRWLWENKHGVDNDDRQSLIHDFQSLVKCIDEMTAFETYTNYMDGILWNKYPKWIIYINSYWSRRHLWCKAWRDYCSKSNDTNSFCEASLRLFKDIVLTRCRAYNVISIIDFITTVMEDYFKSRLRNFSLSRNRKPQLLLQNLLTKSLHLNKLDIVEVDEYMYIIPTEKKDEIDQNYYLVNLELGTCTCDAALIGRFCEHQATMWKYNEKVSASLPAISVNDRYQMAKLALGDKVEDLKFYMNYNKQSINEDSDDCNINTNLLQINENMKHENVVDDFDKINFNCIIEKLQQLDDNYSSSNSGRKMIINRLQMINTKTQWEFFLHTQGAAEEATYRSGSNINLQPLDQHRPNITRVNKKLIAKRLAIADSMKPNQTKIKLIYKLKNSTRK